MFLLEKNRFRMKALLNVFLCAAVLILTLVGADFLLQWYLKIPGQEIKQACTLDPTLIPSKRLKKNLNIDLAGVFNEYRYHVTTNQAGFRQTGSDATENHDFVFLGDSQTFGVGVNDDQTFAGQTGKLFKQSVLNTACPGYNNIEELQIAKQILKTERPKYLILAFFAGNDPFENYNNRSKREPVAQGASLQPKNQKTSFDLKSFLIKKSAIYNLSIRLRQFEVINQLLFKLKVVNDVPPPELIVFKKGNDTQKEAFFKVTRDILLELNQLALASGTHFMIVFIPDRFQVEDDYWSQWVKKYRLDPNIYDRLEPNRWLTTVAAENQIDFLDFTPFLHNQSIRGTQVYWAIDSHLNADGHLTIANALAGHIEKLKS